MAGVGLFVVLDLEAERREESLEAGKVGVFARIGGRMRADALRDDGLESDCDWAFCFPTTVQGRSSDS